MLYFLYLLFITGTDGLRVIGGEVTLAQGGIGILPCKLMDTTDSVLLIRWERLTRGKPQKENFFTISAETGPQFIGGQDNRFQFIGNLADKNRTLQIVNVELLDEGSYWCTFTLFTDGIHKTWICLHLLVPPLSSLNDSHLVEGTEEVTLVTCTAGGSRPPARVTWFTGPLAKKVRTATNQIFHENGTTTTISSLLGVPTKEINHHTVQCVVSCEVLVKKEILSFTIKVANHANNNYHRYSTVGSFLVGIVVFVILFLLNLMDC